MRPITFRERLKQNPSNAEMTLTVALQERGLAHGMFRDVEICLEKTTPDLFWPTKGVAVYLDGEQVHSSERAQLRDDKITDMLTNRGIKVLRFRYRPPLSRKRLNEIIVQIEEAIC